MQRGSVVGLMWVCACGPRSEPPPPTSTWGCPATPDARWSDLGRALERDIGPAPGRVAAVVHDGALVWCGAYGVSGPDDAPMQTSTLQRIGSQTKSLTGLLLLRLAERGDLDLDAPMTDVVADWDLAVAPGWAPQVTPAMLLSHTHGLSDYLEIDSGTSRDDWIRSASASRLYDMAPPGTFWNYSNPGYYLAGWLAEQATGELYEDLLSDLVLSPLGMTRTMFAARDVRDDGDFAEGLDVSGAWNGPGDYDNLWARPAGYLWSSVEDLAHEVQLVISGGTSVVGAASLARWTGRETSTEQLGDLEHYGLGWFEQAGWYDEDGAWRPQRLLLHGGDIPGFATDVLIAPDQRTGLVVLTSYDGQHVGGEAVQAWLDAVEPVAPAAEAPDLGWGPEHLARAVGRFFDPYNVGAMVFTADDDALTLEMPLLDELDIPYGDEVTPVQADQYLLEVQGFPLLLTMLGGEDQAEWARTRVFVARRDEEGVSVRVAPGPPGPEPWRLTSPRALSSTGRP
jgi:CubicO group peptidase (beta-lactamase class C family)